MSSDNRHVLVINDSEVQRSLFKTWLEEEGYRVTEAVDGLDALRFLSGDMADIPDMLVSDLYMPRMDGWKLCRLLRSPSFGHLNHIPIMVVSATFAGDQVRHLALQAGADGFLAAPTKHGQFMKAFRAIEKGAYPPDRERVLLVSGNQGTWNWFDLVFRDDPVYSISMLDPDSVSGSSSMDDYDLLVIDSGSGRLDPSAFITSEHPAYLLLQDSSSGSDQVDPVAGYAAGYSAVIEYPLLEEQIRSTMINILREKRLFNIEDLLSHRSSIYIDQNRFLSGIFDSMQASLVIYNPDRTIAMINSFLKQYFPKADRPELPCYEILKNRKDPCESCTVMEAIQTGRMVTSSEFMLSNERWYKSVAIPLFDEGQRITQVLETMIDVSDYRQSRILLERALDEKMMLVKEIHHRVKNNLQIITSLLNLQGINSDDARLARLLQESQNRIATMALIHEELYRHDNYTSVEISSYLRQVLENILDPPALQFSCPDRTVHLEQAVPLGLIVNELATNAVKYGKPSNDGIHVRGGHPLTESNSLHH